MSNIDFLVDIGGTCRKRAEVSRATMTSVLEALAAATLLFLNKMVTASAKSHSNSEIFNFMEELRDSEDEEMANKNADSGPRPYM